MLTLCGVDKIPFIPTTRIVCPAGFLRSTLCLACCQQRYSLIKKYARCVFLAWSAWRQLSTGLYHPLDQSCISRYFVDMAVKIGSNGQAARGPQIANVGGKQQLPASGRTGKKQGSPGFPARLRPSHRRA